MSAAAPPRSARAASPALRPDGYTLLMHSLQVSSNPGLYPKLPFDTEKDLVPIIFINYNPIVLIGRKSLPPNTFAELVPWMKAHPAKFAIAGLGTTGHMTTVQLLRALGRGGRHRSLSRRCAGHAGRPGRARGPVLRRTAVARSGGAGEIRKSLRPDLA